MRLSTQNEEIDILWSVNIKEKRAYKISPKANFLILSNVNEILLHKKILLSRFS